MGRAGFMAKKIWMRPGGFFRKAGQVVWVRQWLPLCSICFFRNGMFFRIVTEEEFVVNLVGDCNAVSRSPDGGKQCASWGTDCLI